MLTNILTKRIPQQTPIDLREMERAMHRLFKLAQDKIKEEEKAKKEEKNG